MNKEQLILAFIQGAAWWEFQSTKATMWASDKKKARETAEQRFKDKILGKTDNEIADILSKKLSK